MVDEVTKLRSENNELKSTLEKNVAKMRSQIAELEDKNAKLKSQNEKMNDENAELKAQIKAINEQIFMQEHTRQSGLGECISTLMPKKRPNVESNELIAKIDAKRPKLLPNCVPNWLVEVLSWIKRMEMADSFLPTSCRTFNQLCFPKLHGNVKAHTAEPFKFSHHLDKSGNIHANIKHCKYVHYNYFDDGYPHCDYPFGYPIPIPCVPPPAYIQSFKFLDNHLVEFIKGIVHSMKNVDIFVPMILKMEKWNADDKCVALMKRLFNVLRDKISEITFDQRIEHFCRLFPDFFNQAKKLFLWDEMENEKEIAMLVDWLAYSSPNGHAKQKRVTFWFDDEDVVRDIIDRLIEQFNNASQAQLYFINLGSNREPDNFTLENIQTGEMLALYSKINPRSNSSNKFIVRYPKGEEHWKEFGENEFFLSLSQGSINTIFLDIKKFGTNKI